MKKFEVQLLILSHTTVTIVEADRLHCSEHAVSLTNDGINVAVFPIHTVLSVVEYKDDDGVDPHAPKKVPELPTLSREHPVYTYGKGDLVHALRTAASMCHGIDSPSNYLRDIIRDLHKGK